jgi:excisionase family DNA binding protein
LLPDARRSGVNLPTLDELLNQPERLESVDPAMARSLYVRAHTLTGMLLARALAGEGDRHNGVEPPDILTPDEAAKVASVPVSWIRAQAREGHLPSTKLGHYVRIRRDHLMRFLVERNRPLRT